MPRSEPLICLVTDRRRLAPGLGLEAQMDRLAAQVAEASQAGVGLIQLRERDLEAAAQVQLARRLIDAARGTPARIVVNDRADVALAAGAHGVHLRGDSYSHRRLRGIIPTGWLVGRSIHTAAEAAAADQEIDYLIFGAVYATASKPAGAAAAGPDRLREAAARAPVPVLAIGGVSTVRLPAIAAAGAGGVAAIELFLPPAADAPGRAGIAAAVAAIRAAFGAAVD